MDRRLRRWLQSTARWGLKWGTLSNLTSQGWSQQRRPERRRPSHGRPLASAEITATRSPRAARANKARMATTPDGPSCVDSEVRARKSAFLPSTPTLSQPSELRSWDVPTACAPREIIRSDRYDCLGPSRTRKAPAVCATLVPSRSPRRPPALRSPPVVSARRQHDRVLEEQCHALVRLLQVLAEGERVEREPAA